MAIVSILTLIINFLVAGFTSKGLVSFIGSMGSVIATTLLSILFTNLFKIHRAVRPFAENLLYMSFDFISLHQFFMVGIFLASSGAVMMTFFAQGIPMANIINLIYASAELIHAMVGSFELILEAPITALVGGYIYTLQDKKAPR